jgi:hypothetical protein
MVVSWCLLFTEGASEVSSLFIRSFKSCSLTEHSVDCERGQIDRPLFNKMDPTTCIWDPQPPTPGSTTESGLVGVRDPVVWTQDELRVLADG